MSLHHHPKPSTVSSLLSSFNIEGSKSLIIDTVKRGEDDLDVSRGELPAKKGRSVILRVFDALGGKSKGVLTWGDVPVKAVFKTNLLEDAGDELVVLRSGKGVEIEVRAFEVATFRLEL
jgi:alpha-mannosidase